MHRIGVTMLALALAGAPACAELDPRARTPSELRVVLLIAEHRMLTPIFQDQLAQTLQARLQERLGKVAQVEVALSHPLARALHARGLETLDAWEETSDRQTVFVAVDFLQGRYELAARSYSGWLAAADAGPRRAHTNDRLQVGDLAVQLAAEAFTIAGTVTRVGKEIEVTLRGGALGAPLERWAPPGAVLAVSRVAQGPDGPRATRMPWTLLEVLAAPQQGVVRCRLWRRYQQDDLRDEPGVLGYRCQVLPAIQAPVRLRLVDDDTGAPLAGVAVQVTQPGTKKKAELSSDRNGLAITSERFSRFALVQVGQGAGARAQFPVELVGERIVVCRLKAQPEAELMAGLELRRDQWLRRVYDQARLAAERVPELNLLLSKSLKAALEHARRGLEQSDAALEQLSQERDELARQARVKDAAGRLDLAEGEQRLAELTKRREELQQFIGRVEQAIQDNETAQGLAKLLERARLHEQDAEFDQAIALYEKVLEASPDQEKVKTHLDQLKSAWAIKDPRHAKARAFLLETWPRLEATALGQHLTQAEEALAGCKDAGDRLTPRRLLRANTLHVGRLKDRLEALRRQNTEDSRIQVKQIAQVVEGLRRLHQEATALAEMK